MEPEAWRSVFKPQPYHFVTWSKKKFFFKMGFVALFHYVEYQDKCIHWISYYHWFLSKRKG